MPQNGGSFIRKLPRVDAADDVEDADDAEEAGDEEADSVVTILAFLTFRSLFPGAVCVWAMKRFLAMFQICLVVRVRSRCPSPRSSGGRCRT
eukprot:13531123-Heterocapsa_arctica.AAC.1